MGVCSVFDGMLVVTQDYSVFSEAAFSARDNFLGKKRRVLLWSRSEPSQAETGTAPDTLPLSARPEDNGPTATGQSNIEATNIVPD